MLQAPMEPAAAILLAAGESRRMGSLKALLPWQGSTLLAYQIASLRQAGVDPVVVVLGHESGRLKPEVEGPDVEGKEGVIWRVNPDYRQGKTTSIKVGLNALDPGKPSAILILNVDQPRSAETIGRLLLQHREGGRSITIPRYRGKGGHPLVLDSALLEELKSIDEESLGVRAVVRRHQDATLLLEMDTPEVLWDLNTPEQYEAAIRGES
jgi:molybdenum cofactor cytidylyltransferase